MIDAPKTDRCIVCDICKKTYTGRSSYNRHMRMHTGEFKCDRCHIGYSSKELLSRHKDKCTSRLCRLPAQACLTCLNGSVNPHLHAGLEDNTTSRLEVKASDDSVCSSYAVPVLSSVSSLHSVSGLPAVSSSFTEDGKVTAGIDVDESPTPLIGTKERSLSRSSDVIPSVRPADDKPAEHTDCRRKGRFVCKACQSVYMQLSSYNRHVIECHTGNFMCVCGRKFVTNSGLLKHHKKCIAYDLFSQTSDLSTILAADTMKSLSDVSPQSCVVPTPQSPPLSPLQSKLKPVTVTGSKIRIARSFVDPYRQLLKRRRVG